MKYSAKASIVLVIEIHNHNPDQEASKEELTEFDDFFEHLAENDSAKPFDRYESELGYVGDRQHRFMKYNFYKTKIKGLGDFRDMVRYVESALKKYNEKEVEFTIHHDFSESTPEPAKKPG